MAGAIDAEETFFVSFNAPNHESTRTIDTTLTDPGTGFSPMIRNHGTSSRSREMLKLDVSSESSSRNSQVYLDDLERDARRVLVGSGFATSRRHQYQSLSSERTQLRGRLTVSSKTAVWIVVGVITAACVVGVVAAMIVKSSEADGSAGSHEDHPTTATPENGISTTSELPFVPPVNPPKPNVRFELSLRGFSCGFADGKRNELCVSIDQGICVRLIGRRKISRDTIVVVVTTMDSPRFCKSRRAFKEI